RPCSSRFLSLLDRLRRLASPTHSVATLLVVRLSPHLRYYPAVRLLPEHCFSFRLRLWSRFPRCHPRTLEVLLGSQATARGASEDRVPAARRDPKGMRRSTGP